jgi:hypothetical protein
MTRAKVTRLKRAIKNNDVSVPESTPASVVVVVASTTPNFVAEEFSAPMVSDSFTAACELGNGTCGVFKVYPSYREIP